jgi:hypothetical protein
MADRRGVAGEATLRDFGAGAEVDRGPDAEGGERLDMLGLEPVQAGAAVKAPGRDAAAVNGLDPAEVAQVEAGGEGFGGGAGLERGRDGGDDTGCRANPVATLLRAPGGMSGTTKGGEGVRGPAARSI